MFHIYIYFISHHNVYLYNGRGGKGIKKLRINSEVYMNQALSTLTSCSVGAMYQGYQLVLTGRPRAARERLVELTGTTLSVSPLKRAKLMHF